MTSLEEETRIANARLVQERTARLIRNFQRDEQAKRGGWDMGDPYGASGHATSQSIRESSMDRPIQSLARGYDNSPDVGKWEYFQADSLTISPTRQAWFTMLAQQQQSQPPPTWYRTANPAPETTGRASALPQVTRFLDRDQYFQPIDATPRIKGPMVTD